MARTWKMQTVTGHDEEPFFTKSLAAEGWMSLFFTLSCGHRRRYGGRSPSGRITGDFDYGPGAHNIGDKARCYACKKEAP